MINKKILVTLVLLSALALYDMVFRPEILPTPEDAIMVEEIKPQRHQFEICREKLYTKYPNKMNQSEWRNCMAT